MPLATPTYDGIPIFGVVTSFVRAPDHAATQETAFAGVPGVLSLFCGPRGASYRIKAVFVDIDIPSIYGDEALLMSYVDGIARVLTDTRGNSYQNVVFNADYQADPMGPRPTDTGWLLAYTVSLRGLTIV